MGSSNAQGCRPSSHHCTVYTQRKPDPFSTPKESWPASQADTPTPKPSSSDKTRAATHSVTCGWSKQLQISGNLLPQKRHSKLLILATSLPASLPGKSLNTINGDSVRRTSDGEHRADTFDPARLKPVLMIGDAAVDPQPELIVVALAFGFSTGPRLQGLAVRVRRSARPSAGSRSSSRERLAIARYRGTATCPSQSAEVVATCNLRGRSAGVVRSRDRACRRRAKDHSQQRAAVRLQTSVVPSGSKR